MRPSRNPVTTPLALLTVALAALSAGDRPANQAAACGGFFCQRVPINQTAEQIIFRQDGTQITAIVLIQYQGTAEDFSWIVPVPGIPDLSVVPGLLFQTLESATRPRFTLEVNGQACPDDRFFGPLFSDAPATTNAEDSGVTILQEQMVGPFDVQIVTSEDADALATWLNANNYDLTERGSELIAPYVAEGMNFVALRLRQDRGVGDIEPLQMVYQSERPMIPIRLTAVAAQPNLGIIVWLLGPARAVPVNYLHVTPNYARLDWYSGTFNAYGSYQSLITVAMDEVGGQGFATDYAGRDASLIESVLTRPQQLREEAARLGTVPDAAAGVAQLINGFVFPGSKVLEIYRRRLPLPEGVAVSSYGNSQELARVFASATLQTALSATLDELESDLVQPLETALAVFDDDPYLTRLFTTLSAEEMTLDPQFGFNTDLPDQPLERSATLDLACNLGQTTWTLTLGDGTGRSGEVVMEGSGEMPFSVPELLAAQSPVKDAVMLLDNVAAPADGSPQIVVDNDFDRVVSPPGSVLPLCDLGVVPALALFGLAFTGYRRRVARGRQRN